MLKLIIKIFKIDYGYIISCYKVMKLNMIGQKIKGHIERDGKMPKQSKLEMLLRENSN